MTTDRQDRIDRYRQRLAAEPGCGVFVPLAELLAEGGDTDGALAVLEAGLARRPQSLPGRVVLGRTLLAAGRGDRAREILGEVLGADPGNLVARRLLADDCRARGDWDGAVAHLEQLVEGDPQDSRWPAALAEARTRRDGGTPPPGAGGFATMTMVDIYIAQGYHERAAEALRAILSASPAREDARRRLETLEAAAAEGEDAPAGPPVGEPAAAPQERARRRAEDKAQFAEWIERVRHDGEPMP